MYLILRMEFFLSSKNDRVFLNQIKGVKIVWKEQKIACR